MLFVLRRIHESQSVSSYIFIGRLEIETNGVTIILSAFLLQALNIHTHQTRIHSCRSFPCASCFGQTSKKKYMSFLSGFDLLGITNRIMCMRRPDCGSPLSIMERIFFYEVVRRPWQQGGAAAMA
jgi:hypothetical protein